ncbi:MAG: hypothetical protein ABI667_04280 [Sphingomicrobium sp.]
MKSFAALIAFSVLSTSPALASAQDAEFASSGDIPSTQMSMFVGASYRVGLDRRTTNARGRASLKVAGMSYVPGRSGINIGSGLELASGKSGKPTFYMAGQDLGQFKNKAGLNGSTTVVVAIVGVALVAGAVILATHCDNDCDNAKNE